MTYKRAQVSSFLNTLRFHLFANQILHFSKKYIRKILNEIHQALYKTFLLDKISNKGAADLTRSTNKKLEVISVLHPFRHIVKARFFTLHCIVAFSIA